MEVLGVEGGRSMGWNGTYQIDTGQLNTSKTLYPAAQSYMDHSASLYVLDTMSIHNHGPSLSLEIDLLFKVTRVSQCVFTMVPFRGRTSRDGTTFYIVHILSGVYVAKGNLSLNDFVSLCIYYMCICILIFY